MLLFLSTGTTGSEYSLPERRVGSLQYKKRITHQTSTLSEDIKHQYNSSNESIGSLRSKSQSTKSKTKASSNTQSGGTNSGIIPEVTRELRLMQRPVNGYKFGDDRLVLVSNKHVPFLVFSALPYNKGQRSSWYDNILQTNLSKLCRRLFKIIRIYSYRILFIYRSELRKDTSRRKNISVQRPLSAINDNIDPFGLLGIERAKDGQVSIRIKNCKINEI